MVPCLADMIKDHSLDFVCIQDTHKRDFKKCFLRRIDCHDIFEWDWIPSIGRSGGMLCGVKKNKFDLVSCVKRKYSMQMNLFDTSINVFWSLCCVYGAAHEEDKQEFLVELVDMCSHIPTPYIVGGDFNIIRHYGDKNKN